MRLAFALYKYFPFGGLARDFMRIAKICIGKGHSVDVYVMEWQGDLEAEFKVSILPSKGCSNHAKVADFHRQFTKNLKQEQYDVVIGFNKMPGLDVYYAADPCYLDRFTETSFLKKLNPRYRFYAEVEESVFGVSSGTVCLMISDVQTALFKKHYHTPTARLVALPPGIDLNRRKPPNAKQRREAFREELKLTENELLVLMVGTGFKTKGVDRAMEAIASLPETLQSKIHLMVVGVDDISSYERLAIEKGIAEKVHFMGGRPDVPDFLLAADLLVHPARKENTGTVILEAMVAGLPMLVTDVCGYAKHVSKSKAGEVLPSPFSQVLLNKALEKMLVSDKESWINNALEYAENEDLYSMPEKAVEAIEKVAESRLNVS
ncbi:MAG: UDP-glucose--LPS alpha 1,3-glucosyltransferase WaaG [Cycloclasticus sp.]|nr:MAG: UDP-glucose--LPS alpha 1,3-glucosyltransferase WaaG [Cycloclasticus sp.]